MADCPASVMQAASVASTASVPGNGMMLSNFIRRNGKRKVNKVVDSRSHQKSFSASESSQLAPPMVFDINEESLAAQRSPAVELDLSNLNSNEEWFPQGWPRSRSCSPGPSPRRAQNATITQSNLKQEAHTSRSPQTSSICHSEHVSPSIVAVRKKSIPAPIIIPDPEYLMPNVQIGNSAVPSGIPHETSQPSANEPSLNPPSPSASDNLSSISGTTLARALIASSFVLSSSERRSSRHRSGVARQDSATLPRGSFFLSDGSSSPIPPVPPVPANLASVSSDTKYPSTITSGASTDSEYPMSDSYITSPEMAASSTVPRRISCIQEIPSPTAPISDMTSPPTVPDKKPQRKACPPPTRIRAYKDPGLFDGPKTAIEVPLPTNSHDSAQHSSQEGSFLLSSDDHSLDEYDFVAPEPLVMVASPESDSSASYIASFVSLPRRHDTSRGQRKRKVVGSNLIRKGSKDNSMTDGSSASHQVHGLPSATISEHDYGELHNYDLTVSPDLGTSSSASAGYQTFPETPVVFSPLWSPGFTFLAKSDSQMLRRRVSSLKSAGYRPGKMHSSVKAGRRHVANNNVLGCTAPLRRSRSSMLPRQKTPSPKLAESKLLPAVPVNEDGSAPDERHQLPTTNEVESQQPAGLLSVIRPHPLAHISTSSSCLLEEEALRALAKHSPSSLPSSIIGEIDSSFDPTATSATDPTSIPLPDSTDVSPSDSPGLASSSAAVSSSSSSSSPLYSTSTAISSTQLPKSPLSPPSPSLDGSSFLPSPSASLDEPLPQINSAKAVVPSVVVSDDLVTHSPSPSFIPPPPYHSVMSDKTAHPPKSMRTHPLSRTPSTDLYQRSRQASNSSLSGSVQSRMRSRPPLPIGPRKPSGSGQVLGLGPLFPGIRDGSTSSMASGDTTHGSGLSWRKLHAAASHPPPKFQAPAPKWRGLTLEAAQWTFTSAQLQQIVSQAIQQSSEGCALRFLRPDVLDGEIADEMHRLELQHLEIRSDYKELTRKRGILLGHLAGHIEGVENNDVMTAAHTLEELAEVFLELDRLTDKMHDTVLQMAQLKSLRDVHNTSALALAVRKINDLFVRQMAEKERLQEQVDTFRTERDEAWRHAKELAQDFDALNDRVSINGDACSGTGSKRSTRIEAVRKSSVRQSQAGLRSRCRHQRRRSSSNATRPSSLASEDIPPVPRLPANPSIGSSALPLSTGISFGSAFTHTADGSAAMALADAQREVYEMLGLSLPPSQASSRRRTMSGPSASRPPSPSSRPVSESLEVHRRVRRVRSRQEMGKRTVSVILDDRYPVRPLTIIRH